MRCLILLLLLAVPATAAGPDPTDTRLLSMPAVSADAHRLRLRRRPVGRRPRRQEPPPAHQRHRRRVATPSSRPDGADDRLQRPVRRQHRRLHHPGRRRRADAADLAPRPGRRPRLHARTARASCSRRRATSSPNRHTQLFTVPLDGGMPTQLPIPWGFEASYSPDGEYIAYTPVARRDRRSGSTTAAAPTRRIWVYDVKTTTSTEIPQPKDRCNDLDPHWVGDTVYFRSDRAGEYNVFAYDADGEGRQAGHAVHRLPGRSTSAPAAATLVFEQAGYLHLLDPRRDAADAAARSASPPTLVEARPRFAKGAKYVRGASVSPSGARVAVEFRGEIVTVPGREGRPAQPDQHRRRPRARPGLVAGRQDDRLLLRRGRRVPARASPRRTARARRRRSSSTGAGFYDDPVWSPRLEEDRLPSTTRRRSTGSTSRAGKVDEDRRAEVRPGRGPEACRAGRRTRSGSPTRWTRRPRSRRVYVYSLEQDKSFADHRRAERRRRAGVRRVAASTCTSSARTTPGMSKHGFAPVGRRHAGRRGGRSTWPCCRRTCRRRSCARATRRRAGGDEGRGRRRRTTTTKKDEPKKAKDATVVDRLRRASTSASWRSRCRRATTRSLQAGAAGQVFYLVRPEAGGGGGRGAGAGGGDAASATTWTAQGRHGRSRRRPPTS